MPRYIIIERTLPDGTKITVRYDADASDDNERLGPYTPVDRKIVGREDKGLLLEVLASAREHLAGIRSSRPEPDPEPIYGTEDDPYHGTDVEFLARERHRQSAFETEWGIGYETKREDTTGTNASPQRVPMTYREKELPTGNAEYDKNIPTVLRERKEEVPYGYDAIVPSPKIRVVPEYNPKIADSDEEVLRGAEELKQARRLQANR